MKNNEKNRTELPLMEMKMMMINKIVSIIYKIHKKRFERNTG